MLTQDNQKRLQRTHTLAIASMLAVLCTNSPSYSQEVDWGRKSALLEQEMTEQQVMQAVGYRPNKVELTTCGQRSVASTGT
jgi:hypothetical protein